ncbi:ATP-binding protein [Nocardiopsis eucommiae]|uniref:ATP-binding protein n=1 Tax=Nocardiopsis eucommiae TaxID=2831970 RepID=UPI003D761FA7
MLPVQGTRLARITRILVTNSHQHSRSGLPGGTVRVVLDQSRPLLPHLYVTDQGPRDTVQPQYPQLNPRDSASGLAVLNRLALSWNPSWTWDGNRIQQTTVEVVLDLS